MLIHEDKRLIRICDYTGEVLTNKHWCTYPYVGTDPVPNNLEQAFSIDFDIPPRFLSQEYYFLRSPGADSIEGHTESLMMQYALGHAYAKESEWFHTFTFDSMCRVARIVTATRLLNKKLIKPNQMVFEVRDARGTGISSL